MTRDCVATRTNSAFATFKRSAARRASESTELGLRNPHPGIWCSGVVVVAWGVGRDHIEISGSATGLTSRPSAEMRPQSQAASAGVSRTTAHPPDDGVSKIASALYLQ